jgi:uncharacterized protein (DUF169 family)
MNCNEVYGISSLLALTADTQGLVSDQRSPNFCVGCKGDYKMSKILYFSDRASSYNSGR